MEVNVVGGNLGLIIGFASTSKLIRCILLFSKNQHRLKSIGQFVCVLNLICIFFGIFYAFYPANFIAWDIFGTIMFIALISNLLIIYLLDHTLDKSNPRGHRLNKWRYLSIMVIILGMLGILLGNFFVLTNYADQVTHLGQRYTVVFACYFGPLGVGAFVALSSARYWSTAYVTEEREKHISMKIKNSVKIFPSIMLGCNLGACILGIAYLLSPSYTPLWDILGGIMLVTFLGNLLLLYILDRTLDKTTAIGRRLNIWSYRSLAIIILAMVGLILGNILVSSTYYDLLPGIWWGYAFISLSYFALVGMGMFIANLGLKYYHAGISIKDNSGGTLPLDELLKDRHRKLRSIAISISTVGLIIGIYFSIIILFGGEMRIIFDPITGGLSSLIGILVAMLGVFWAIIILANGLLVIKITRRYHSRKISRVVGIITLITGCIMFIPSAATIVIDVPEAETSFAEAFGANWRAQIPSSVESFFLPTRFVMAGYILGIPPKNCIVKRDILFYDGSTGPTVDAGISLYFDAYLPPHNGIGLPGANSTLIRIHGGGWIMGDKGGGNILQINEYFAAQGYCVFDIEYGLNKLIPTYLPILDFLTPSHVVGNFTINDMIRHVGLFCKYLELHNEEYGANLSSVFISGGSAGGYLTCAAALAIANGTYTELFGTGIYVKGYVPFYPGIHAAGDDTTIPLEFRELNRLINQNSPPCLIYQGLEDPFVFPISTEKFQNDYLTAGNRKCAVIWLSGSSHSGDFYFSGYYSQLFLYYMERFLYLFR
ncbi:MAG: hypothetical protein RBG13Loki_2700 [Promethearchaeota archaeon CR_4]|nr:MAG: hypothetical protein RBG13Loki_2700 [Candidatus Lokiarchaeota archaeon CR_4]